MKKTNSNPQPWNLIPTEPETDAIRSFRRWNIVIISFLALLVLGVFIAAVLQGSI